MRKSGIPTVVPIGQRYLLHPCGLLLNRDERRIIDANSKILVNAEEDRDLEKYRNMLSTVYDQGFPDTFCNAIDASNVEGLKQYVNTVKFALCDVCKLFATGIRRLDFGAHMKASPNCKNYHKRYIIVTGASFKNRKQKQVYIVLEHVADSFGEAVLSDDEDMADTVSVKEKSVTSVQKFVNDRCGDVDEDYEKKIIAQNPEIENVMREYFHPGIQTASILTYLLLDCLTEDLWNASEAVTRSFRFLLRPVGPELVLYDKNKIFQLRLKLTNGGPNVQWGVNISISSMKESDKKKTKLERSEKLNFSSLSYFEVCEILVIFRGILDVLFERVQSAEQSISRAEVSDLVEACLEDITCGPDLAVNVIKRQLYLHIGRIDE